MKIRVRFTQEEIDRMIERQARDVVLAGKRKAFVVPLAGGGSEVEFEEDPEPK